MALWVSTGTGTTAEASLSYTGVYICNATKYCINIQCTIAGEKRRIATSFSKN